GGGASGHRESHAFTSRRPVDVGESYLPAQLIEPGAVGLRHANRRLTAWPLASEPGDDTEGLKPDAEGRSGERGCRDSAQLVGVGDRPDALDAAAVKLDAD